jgi:hypothetical protein
MKLIFCKECQDVVKLDFAKRECKCGRSSGYYEDSLNAVYWGPCVIRWQPDSGQGSVVEAFVIPKKCKTMERLY